MILREAFETLQACLESGARVYREAPVVQELEEAEKGPFLLGFAAGLLEGRRKGVAA